MAISTRVLAEFLGGGGGGGGSEPANLALLSAGASATHNRSIHQSTPADNAIDGNPATYTLILNPANHWLRVDLGQPGAITHYEVEWINNSWYAINYTIESSDDDVTYVVRHTVTGGTDAGTSGQTALTTPTTARYWRMLSTSSGAEGMGPTTFALWGTYPEESPSQDIELPSLVNDSVLYAFEASLRQLGLPLLVNAEVMHGLRVIVPILQNLELPALVNQSQLYPIEVYEPLAPNQARLPFLINQQTFYPMTITTGPVQVEMPSLVNDSVLYGFVIFGGIVAIRATVSHRIYGALEDGEKRYTWGQSLEVRVVFSDADGTRARPETIRLAIQPPDGVERHYTFGVDPEVQEVGLAEYRVPFTGDQAGRWYIRGEGEHGFATPASEADLVVRETEFLPAEE